MDYEKSAHSVYLLTYHLVFVTKYRKRVISDEIGDFMKEKAGLVCERLGGRLLSAETDFDHIHLLVSMPPGVSPSELVRVLKSQLSRGVHSNARFDAYIKAKLYGNAPLWSPSYFVATTGGATLEKVKEYVESQRTEEHRQKRKSQFH